MTSPLEVRARTSRRPPRGMRLLPLAAGLVWMSALAIAGHASGKAAVYLDFLGALLIMAGIVIAGPWLIALGADVAVKRTKRTDVLLAGRRLSDDPRAAFRAISGLVVALFVMSAITGVVSTIVADHGAPAGGAMAVATLTDVLGTPLREGASAPALPAQLLANLRAIKGVGGVAVVRSDPFDTALGLVSCAQLARTPALGRCAPGAVVAAIDRSATWSHGFTNTTDLAGRTWPSASIDVRRLASLAPEEIVVGTDGSTAAIESARTALELGFAYQSQAPLTMGETLSATAQTRTELGNVANVIIGASLVIAGCSLAVGATAAVSDRKRPFSLLRLTGAPVSMLRRVVGLEAAAPLVVAAVLGAGLGLLGAELFLRSELSVSLRWPGLLYLLVVIGGIALSLVVISSTLPLIERITGPDVARSE